MEHALRGGRDRDRNRIDLTVRSFAVYIYYRVSQTSQLWRSGWQPFSVSPTHHLNMTFIQLTTTMWSSIMGHAHSCILSVLISAEIFS